MIYGLLLVVLIAITLMINKNEVCGYEFDARNFLVGIDVIYGVDCLLMLWQLSYLKKNLRESLGIVFLRYLALVALVVWLILGNVHFYKGKNPV